MKRLIVFMGKPGAGKSTLIQEMFPGHAVMDVRPFVTAYLVNGRLPEEKTLQGYHDMYAALEDMSDDEVILELGTNHAQLNVDNLAVAKKKHPVFVFLCTASVETLRQRVKDRPIYDDMEAMERRFARDFPNTHLSLFETAGIEPYFLDMEQPMTDNIILVKQVLGT